MRSMQHLGLVLFAACQPAGDNVFEPADVARIDGTVGDAGSTDAGNDVRVYGTSCAAAGGHCSTYFEPKPLYCATIDGSVVELPQANDCYCYSKTCPAVCCLKK